MAVTAYLRRTADHGEQRPFGFYRITRAADGQAIGGIGLKGKPEYGSVEIGYGLIPSARGNGYAADTDRVTIASQRTLERAGFTRQRNEADLYFYEAILGDN